VGGKTVARIEPAFLVDGLKLRQLVTVRLDEGLFIRRDAFFDRNRLVAWRGAIVAQSGPQLIQIHVQAFCDQWQIGVPVAVLFANQKTGDRGVVVHQQVAVAIEEFAAGGQHRLLADAILLGEKPVVVRTQHLQPPKPSSQRQHHQQNAVLHRRQLQGGELLAAIDSAGIHISGVRIPPFSLVVRSCGFTGNALGYKKVIPDAFPGLDVLSRFERVANAASRFVFRLIPYLQTIQQRKQHHGEERVADRLEEFRQPTPLQIEPQQPPIDEDIDRAAEQGEQKAEHQADG